jgi:hypothetical protein
VRTDQKPRRTSSGFQIEAGGKDSYCLTTNRNCRRVPTSRKIKFSAARLTGVRGNGASKVTKSAWAARFTRETPSHAQVRKRSRATVLTTGTEQRPRKYERGGGTLWPRARDGRRPTLLAARGLGAGTCIHSEIRRKGEHEIENKAEGKIQTGSGRTDKNTRRGSCVENQTRE